MESVLGWALSGSSVDLSFLKTGRVLRPLRTIRRFPSLRQVMGAVTGSLASLAGIMAVFVFALTICSMLGVVLWSGQLRMRCAEGTGAAAIFDDELLCGIKEEPSAGVCAALGALDAPYECRADDGFTCQWFGDNPEDGLVSFDNLLWSFLVMFQVTTLEGWSDVCFQTQNVSTEYTYFVFLCVILLCSFTILNLVIAVLVTNFNSHHMEEEGEGPHA
ncbi:unnamed protein product, partial [Chrysoparadoxa australica]